MDLQVSPATEVIFFVQVWGSLLLRVGTQIDNLVLVQISAQLTQVLALETDPAERENFASIFELSRYVGSYCGNTLIITRTRSLQRVTRRLELHNSVHSSSCKVRSVYKLMWRSRYRNRSKRCWPPL